MTAPAKSYRGMYKKTKRIGTCQVCRGPIMRNRPSPKAVACSHECLWKWHARKLKERPIRSKKYSNGGKFVTNGGYSFVNIESLPDELKGFAKVMVINNTSHLGSKYIQEHRVVLSGKLGRPLLAHEYVHHKDRNKLNNHPDNLELWVGTHGAGARAIEVVCPHCGKSYA